jgi:ABC-type Mn2+/Zn2+ transport system permease subunit
METLLAYNTLVVLMGTLLIGVAAGITGAFLLLRGRALAGDVIGHAALPGVALAFLLHSSLAPEAGKSLPVMLLGGALASGAGMFAAMWLRRVGRLPEDAVLAIVLSSFFGCGRGTAFRRASVAHRQPSGAARIYLWSGGRNSFERCQDVSRGRGGLDRHRRGVDERMDPDVF